MRRHIFFLLFLFIATALSGTPVMGDTLYWYPQASPQGGTGTWDGANSKWSETSGTKTTATAPPTTADDVVFGGAAGTVTLSTNNNLGVADFRIDTANYIFMVANVTSGKISLSSFSGNEVGSSTITGSRSNSTTTLTLNFFDADSSTVYNGIIRDNVGTNTTIALIKDGPGFLDMTNATLSYTGTTTVTGGTLRLKNDHLPTGFLQIGGGDNTSGIFEINGGGSASSLTRALGSGSGEIRLGGFDSTQVDRVSGFSAYNGQLTVNLGGEGAEINWSSSGFARTNVIQLGASTSTHTVILENALKAPVDGRTLRAGDGAAAIDGELSGAVNVSAGKNAILNKDGAGVLLFSGDSNAFVGRLNVMEGTLLIDGSVLSTTDNGTYGVNVVSGATLGGDGTVSFANASTRMIIDGMLLGGRGEGNQSLTINSNLEMGSNSILAFGLESSASDQLIRLGGTWNFQTNQQVTLWDAHITKSVFSYALITGLTGPINVDNWVLYNTDASIDGTFRYDGGSGTVYFDMIPEPSTLLLTGLAGIGIIALIFRRRRP